MIKFVYPEKDTFISNHPSLLTRNFGKDEILEVENRRNYIIDSDLTLNDAESRALIKFNLNEISQSIVNGDISNPTFFLRMKVAQFVEVPQDFKIIANPISQSWAVGTGRYADEYEKNGASWTYRFAETMSWSGQTVSSSLNGGTWYETITSHSINAGTASMEITSINLGDTFIVTDTLAQTYTFSPQYVYTSQSMGFASASITINSLTNFDRYTINGLESASITVVNKFTPKTCGNELFIGWDSDTTTDSTITVEFTTASLYAGKKYVLSDSITSWSFIATDNMGVPDLDCGTRFFYVNDDNYHNVTSLSLEINDVNNFNVTTTVSSSISSGVTSSFLIITTSGMGELGNDGYFLDFDDYTIETTTGSCGETLSSRVYTTQPTVGGTGSGMYSRMNDFSDALSSITSSLGINFNINGNTIYFTASISGSAGEAFSIVSGSTEIFFGGAYESSSYSIKSDDISNNLYYFGTGSALTSSIGLMVTKINETLDFITVNQSGSVLTFTGSVGGTGISFQSGSTSVSLDGAKTANIISSSISQSFLNETGDLNLNITPIVNSWLSGEIENEGIILRNDSFNREIDSGKVRFYSKDTNTIYVPRIEVIWDNQTFSTGNLKAFSLDSQNVVKVKSVKPYYKNVDVERFRILSRVEYPEKTYANQFSRYTTTTYLPQESQYAIKDAESEEFVIDFSIGTKISCDSSGSFFDLDMSTLPQERYYIIYIKVVDGGLSEIFESSQPFKISR